jgi:8-oxo-dGTP pyrophosphatase MutT (NUDIX family)
MKNPLLVLAYQLYRLKHRLLRSVTVGVRILLIQDGQVLLVRHTYHDGWQFPGGGVKYGETLAQAATREALEETGAQLTETPRLLGVYTYFGEGKSDHVLVFYSEQFLLTQATDRWEIAEARLFPIAEPPTDLLAGYRRRLRDYLDDRGPYAKEW